METRMNDLQKRTLRQHYQDILHDLDLSPELRSKFIQNGILNEDMEEEIMAEKTRKDKVLKFLQILPRRGPRAFDKFLHSIHDHYSWISDKLRDTYHKLASKTEADAVNLKKKVGIFVHEEFGNSKRFCEQDKKRIEKFLYKQLKNPPVTDIFGHEVERARRNSMDSTASEQSNNSDVHVTDQKDIEIEILTRIYTALGNSNERSAESSDVVDGKFEITIEMIESKVKTMSARCERLTNEMNDCYTALGIEGDCDIHLHQIIEKLVERHESDEGKITTLKETCQSLHEEVQNLNSLTETIEKDLEEKEKELRNLATELAESRHHNMQFETQLKDLKAKCNRLEKANSKFAEKRQRLQTLKSMVKEMQGGSNPVQDISESDMDRKPEGLRLPMIHNGIHEPGHPRQKGLHRKGQVSCHSDNHEDPRLTHHPTHHPPFRHSTNNFHGLPWKF